jgi:acyl carrier protein
LRTLSEVIREQGVERIDLLKIDAEKSELDVLMGIAENDWHKIQQIVIEAHEAQLAPMTALLEQHGYTVWVEADKYIEGSGLFNLYATRHASTDLHSHQHADSELISVPVLADTIVKTEELRQYLRESLPEYMVPADFVLLEALPLTPNGKVDRRALPAPTTERADQQVPFVAPRTAIEKSLAAIWSEVLGIAQVGVHDDFFDLGGHSLSATQVIARVLSTLHADVPVRSLMTQRTVASMAEVIVQHQAMSTSQKALDNMMAELEQLSDEDAQRLLSRGAIKDSV